MHLLLVVYLLLFHVSVVCMIVVVDIFILDVVLKCHCLLLVLSVLFLVVDMFFDVGVFVVMSVL